MKVYCKETHVMPSRCNFQPLDLSWVNAPTYGMPQETEKLALQRFIDSMQASGPVFSGATPAIGDSDSSLGCDDESDEDIEDDEDDEDDEEDESEEDSDCDGGKAESPADDSQDESDSEGPIDLMKVLLEMSNDKGAAPESSDEEEGSAAASRRVPGIYAQASALPLFRPR